MCIPLMTAASGAAGFSWLSSGEQILLVGVATALSTVVVCSEQPADSSRQPGDAKNKGDHGLGRAGEHLSAERSSIGWRQLRHVVMA
jgi:hypothetical protein